MTIPSKNMSDPCKTEKNQNLCPLLSINVKKNVKLHHQAAEQKIIVNDV